MNDTPWRPRRAPAARGRTSEQRREHVPDERHRAQLGDDRGEQDPVAKRRRQAGVATQSLVGTRWFEVAKIHEMPKPAVTPVSFRTSGLGANDAPWRSS
jgi:hypothetical protein